MRSDANYPRWAKLILLKADFAQELLVPVRRVAAVEMVRLLLDAGAQWSCEDETPSDHPLEFAYHRNRIRNMLQQLDTDDRIKLASGTAIAATFETISIGA